MAFFNKFLKRRKTGERPEAPKRDEVRPALPEKKSESVDAQSIRFGVGSSIERAYITEKTALAGERGTYTFIVANNANKNQVKRAVEEKYGTKVENVNVLSMPRKMRRRGRQIGWKAGFKKAVVRLKEGARIDVQ
jgi:large subunit ribosomal protein L23